MTLIWVGAVLIVLGVLSRLFSLALFRRISSSPTRDVQPSALPGTPWLRVSSDRTALNVIVRTTYVTLLIGMALVMSGVIIDA